MKTYQLTAEARTDLGKKAAKALRKENKIPVVLNGGKLVELDKDGKYNGKLLAGMASCSLARRSFPSAVTARASSPPTW